MKMRFRNIIHVIFDKIYYYLAISAVFMLTFIAGLGIFGFIPAHKISFKIYDRLYHERYKEKVKVFRIFKNQLGESLKENFKISLVYSALLLVLAVDILYFSTSISPIHTGLFYLFLILSFWLINSLLMSLYIDSTHEGLTFKENIQNSLALTIVNIVDILLMDIILGLVFFALYKMSFILIILLFPGIFIEIYYYFFTRILAKKSLTYLLFNLS